MAVGQHLADITRIGKPVPLREAQEESRQPVGVAAADQEQVIVLELVEEPLGRQMLALQRADELERVFVRDHVRRRRRQPPHQVVDNGALQVLALRGQVGHAVRRIRDDFGRLCAAEALVVDRLLEQRIEGRRDKKIEVGDLRQLPQRLRRPKGGVAQDAPHSRIRLLAPAARSEEPADDVVQRVRLRQLLGVHTELAGELLGDPVVEQARPRLGLDLDELGTDDRDDVPLLDEVEQVIPRVVVERGERRMHRQRSAHSDRRRSGSRISAPYAAHGRGNPGRTEVSPIRKPGSNGAFAP